MGSLFTALRNTGSSMRVFERAIGVVQGNVTNASTPGYAKQRQLLTAMRFDLDNGLPGGVASGGTIDSRSAFADRLVRQRLDGYGAASERTTQLTRLEILFDISDNSGLNAALGRFFQAASSLTITPNDISARNVLLDRARELARSFNGLADGLASAKYESGKALEQQLDRVETIASEVAGINRQFREDFTAQNDPGLQSRLNNLLEELSEIVDITVLRAEDGSATIYLGGQSLLVIGDRQYDYSAQTGGATAQILDSEGNDISPMITSGRIAALLGLRNTTIPDFQAKLDRLAESVATEVNGVLAAGVDLDGNAPAQDLFSFDSAFGSARTLRVNNLAASELALADAAAPRGNGGALRLADLAKSQPVDGYSFSQYYGGLAAEAGRALSMSQEDLHTQENLLAQSRQFRDEIQGVDLNEEALTLLQYQRSYEAAAKLIQTLDEMTQTVIQMVR
jgi:flagellar hook-associated protein 1 FlgK